jgi:hypothetical protein
MPARVVRSDGLVFVLQHLEVTVADAEAIVQRFLEIKDQRRPYLVVSEARGVAVPSARVRQILGSSNSPEAHAMNQGRASAIIVDSALLRGAIISVSWFLTHTIMKPFETAKAALPFLEQQATEQKIRLTEADRACVRMLDDLWTARRPSTELTDPRA